MVTARPTSPRKQPRQARSKATVDAILEATARVLIEEGYDRASTNRVAKVAGVSIGSLYQYFPNKAALVTALMDAHIDEMIALLAQRVIETQNAPLEVAVRVMVESMIDAHKVQPDLHRVFAHHLPRVQGDRLRTLEVRAGEMLEAFIASRAADIRPDIDGRLASFILGRSVDALTHAAVIDHPEILDDPKLIDEIVMMVLRYLQP